LSGIYTKLYEILAPIQNVLEWIVIFFYKNWHIASYGICIILLTIVVRLVLTPLTISQTKSMAKMQKLQPQLKEIQEKYKGDKQKIQQETMEFYKKNNVNPLAGCLPLLLQMPVFFALFNALRAPSQIITSVLGEFTVNGVVNQNFNFLWMNLNEKDPYYILPILMIATMFLSTKMTTTDPKQSKIMYIMPIVFGFISINLASGILVYWVTTNVWSIGQQWVVNKFIIRGKKEEELKQKVNRLAEEELSVEERKKISGKRRKKRKKKN